MNVFHFHTLRLVLRYFTVSLPNPIPHRYCGGTLKKCPAVNTRRDPMNHGIFLVLVSFLYLGKSDTSASPSFWSRRLPASTPLPRSNLFQGAAYKTDFLNFLCRKPILSNLQHRSYQHRDGAELMAACSCTWVSFSLLPPSQLINKQGPE